MYEINSLVPLFDNQLIPITEHEIKISGNCVIFLEPLPSHIISLTINARVIVTKMIFEQYNDTVRETTIDTPDEYEFNILPKKLIKLSIRCYDTPKKLQKEIPYLGKLQELEVSFKCHIPCHVTTYAGPYLDSETAQQVTFLKRISPLHGSDSYTMSNYINVEQIDSSYISLVGETHLNKLKSLEILYIYDKMFPFSFASLTSLTIRYQYSGTGIESLMKSINNCTVLTSLILKFNSENYFSFDLDFGDKELDLELHNLDNHNKITVIGKNVRVTRVPWSSGRIKQAIARAIRYTSHYDLDTMIYRHITHCLDDYCGLFQSMERLKDVDNDKHNKLIASIIYYIKN